MDKCSKNNCSACEGKSWATKYNNEARDKQKKEFWYLLIILVVVVIFIVLGFFDVFQQYLLDYNYLLIKRIYLCLFFGMFGGIANVNIKM